MPFIQNRVFNFIFEELNDFTKITGTKYANEKYKKFNKYTFGVLANFMSNLSYKKVLYSNTTKATVKRKIDK